MSSELTITNLFKDYCGKVILKDINFQVKAGEFIVLVGPSGCGKSTLLRSIAGLETVTSGAISIDQREVTSLPPKDRDVAMVFQDYALYPHKSVYENIAFGLRIRKVPEAQIDLAVKEAAAKLDLMPYLQRRPAALSGGQRQRVAIGRSIVRNPKVFLFDEPLSNLDAKLRGSMRITIAKLHKELKSTILYVTHDQVEAMTLADRIIVLEGGNIQQAGSPLDLYYHPSNIFVATFIGSPAMNLIDGRVEERNGRLVFIASGGLEHTLSSEFSQMVRQSLDKVKNPKSEVIWGIRPENLRNPGSEVSGPVFDANVIVTELLGPTTQVICDIKGHEVQVSLPAPHRPRPGDKIQLELRSKHFYMFDKLTGKTLLK